MLKFIEPGGVATNFRNGLEMIKNEIHFIANSNQQPFNAVKVTEAIFETINKIGLNPLAYRECEQLHTKTKITAGQYVCLG